MCAVSLIFSPFLCAPAPYIPTLTILQPKCIYLLFRLQGGLTSNPASLATSDPQFSVIQFNAFYFYIQTVLEA